MMTDLQVTLLGWSHLPVDQIGQGSAAAEAGFSGLSANELDLSFIPSALRRRCSVFSRVTLAVARAALGDFEDITNLSTVFASAHGEAGITLELLRDLARGQQLSPMGFSLSVHNAASGLFSIALQDKAASTALAAGSRTFLMGLCEAILSVPESPSGALLYVCSDDVVPGDFLPTGVTSSAPCAVALLLGDTAKFDGCTLRLQYRQMNKVNDSAGDTGHAQRIVEWLSGTQGELSLCDGGNEWQFCRLGDSTTLMRSVKRARTE